METKTERKVSADGIVMEGKFWIDRNGVKYRYIDPMTDKGFKILFGSEGNEDLLMGLLNRIIPDADIVDLRYCNPEHQGMTEEDGCAVFDVYCENSDGVRFLVEVQNWSQRYFNKRAVYYSTFAIQDQANKEKRHQLKTLGKDRWDYNYAPVFMVCFLNFNMRRVPDGIQKVKEDDYISFYRYTDIESGEALGDGTTLVFVEMLKFRKSQDECATKRESLLCTLKNMRGQLKTPDNISDPLLKEIYDRGELAAIPEHLRTTYINFIMSRNDELNSRAEMLEEALYRGREEGREIGLQIGREMGVEIGIEEGKKEGIEIGREEGKKEGVEIGREEGKKEGVEIGREEGREETMVENARKLKELGVDIQIIVQAIGLDAETIAGL